MTFVKLEAAKILRYAGNRVVVSCLDRKTNRSRRVWLLRLHMQLRIFDTEIWIVKEQADKFNLVYL